MRDLAGRSAADALAAAGATTNPDGSVAYSVNGAAAATSTATPVRVDNWIDYGRLYGDRALAASEGMARNLQLLVDQLPDKLDRLGAAISSGLAALDASLAGELGQVRDASAAAADSLTSVSGDLRLQSAWIRAQGAS